jgi:hypothetical protein
MKNKIILIFNDLSSKRGLAAEDDLHMGAAVDILTERQNKGSAAAGAFGLAVAGLEKA